MGFSRLEDKGVSFFYGGFALFRAYDTLTADDVVELPLSVVGVVGAVGLAGGECGDGDVEGVPLHQVGRVHFSSERGGQVQVCSAVFAFWGLPGVRVHFVGIDNFHEEGDSSG